MAIVSFSLTTEEFISGRKKVTRRDWSNKHLLMWQNFWDKNHLLHDAWDKIPIAGGKFIGNFRLTNRPYIEQLKEMPVKDLKDEGGMCSSLEEFYNFIGKSPNDYVTVLRFEKL